MSHKCIWCDGRRSGSHRIHRTIEQMAVEVQRAIDKKPEKRTKIITHAALYGYERGQLLLKDLLPKEEK